MENSAELTGYPAAHAPCGDSMLPASDSLRQQVEQLENTMRELPQVELPLIHGFGPGFYARSLMVPEGTVLTGKVHSTRHIFMVTHGDISITTDSGTVRVQAPYMAICEPGSKRAGFAHADTVCVNIHITEEQNLERLEAQLIEAPAVSAPVQEGSVWAG